VLSYAVYALLLVAAVLYLPRGIVPALRTGATRLARSGTAKED
jgi:ABC-type branched-subunit amino acid transport system permease subunit